MKQRITFFILGIVMLSVMLSMALLHFIYFDDVSTQIVKEMNIVAKVVENLVEDGNYDNCNLIENEVRLIDSKGILKYENYSNDEKVNSELVEEAFEKGESYGLVYSTTLETQVYKYYFKINEDTVVELYTDANSINSAYSNYILGIILIFLIILTVCGIFSVLFVKNLIQPIYETDFNSSEHQYEELQPFIKKINNQRTEIEKSLYEKSTTENITFNIINSIKEGLIIIDNRNYIKMYNTRISKIIGEYKKDYTFKNILEMFRDEKFISNIEKAKSGFEIDYNMNINEKIYRVLMSKLKNINNEEDVLIVFLDITSMVNAENIRHEFTSNVSHELKTPLTSILGYSELILSGIVEEEKQLEFVGKIKKETDNLVQLIEEIILLSKLDEVKNKEFDTFYLNKVILENIERLNQEIIKKNINVIFDNVDIQFTGNEKLMSTLIYNLINNAIKYNNDYGDIIIKLVLDNNNIILTVEDTGIGIPEEHIDRIFERFYRVDNSRSTKTGGTGLGLSIVKKIVKYHDAKVIVRSKKDSGSKFTVIL